MSNSNPNSNRFSTRTLALSACIAAIYALMGYFSSIFGVAYGPFQCRFSEALCVLPFLFPQATWGLFVGCVITNLLSPYGMLDVVLGSGATLIAALLTQRMPSKWLAPLPPVLVNAVVIGALLGYYQAGFTSLFWGAFAYNAFTVGVGQAVACYALGLPLMKVLQKTKVFGN